MSQEKQKQVHRPHTKSASYLVYPGATNAAHHVTFIVAGSGKAERLREVLAEPYQPDVLPAQIVRPADGHLLWLVDAAAATRWRKE